MKKKICIITASTGENLRLANSFKEHVLNNGFNASLINVVDLDLPLYSPKAHSANDPSKIVSPFKEDLNADGFIFVAPEYNGAPPPAFTNFLAWVSVSTKDWRETLNRKTAMIATASGGGGQSVLMHMRMQLSFIGMNLLGRQVISTGAKPIDHAGLEKYVTELIETIK